MKIYTRTGDNGQTDTGDGRRLAKDSAQMELTGTLDELNSLLGVCRSLGPSEAIDDVLRRIQSELFLVGAEVTYPGCACGGNSLVDEHVQQLEADIDSFDAELPKLQAFILPGGTSLVAVIHLARSVCRRTERRLITFMRTTGIESPQSTPLAYLNRLSDLLFVMARAANHSVGAEDIAVS